MLISPLPFLDSLDDDGGSSSSSSSFASDDVKELPKVSFTNKMEYNSVIIENTAAAAETEEILSTDVSFLLSTNDAEKDKKQVQGQARSPYSYSLFSLSPSQKGRLVLLVLAVGYGSLNVSTRLVFARANPPEASVSSTIQGWFSVLCFLPLLWGKHHRQNTNSPPPMIDKIKNDTGTTPKPPSFTRFALELGMIDFGIQALINSSLMATPGARASFLIQMSVVFTPVVSVVLGKQRVHKQVWLACFVALAGLFVLSQSSEESEEIPGFASDGFNDIEHQHHYTTSKSKIIDFYLSYISNFSMSSLTLSQGDCSCLWAALCWSFYIYRMSTWADSFEETATQFVKNSVVAISYTIWMLVSFFQQNLYSANGDSSDADGSPRVLWNGWKDPVVWIILFYNAMGPCTIADVWQQKAQAYVPAAETNVILSLEPVFTTLLGFMVLGETPSPQELGGGLLITIASIIASCGPDPQAPSDCSPCPLSTSSR
mmetsp:Transcript_5866/g.13670  ORF Transcript_5866/g.13670 Transcript_5866/m.13670 type:complete len:486 (-) Transcript_5866:1060-2517(-)|eukprot:CAMPEP_0168165562 /NCGR_PEP_ID=MMETSP0139_2-20121125/1555_1 /TAXON_ID=44445 /ORGANISM="Pseudo-nitzschia australis, Strain 10249 10 AB" /LENGTH=485 /DNA_ID=CAMNT_0008082691 /DNA_START=184 /DNA_END=1641 /DNA_ORIENTATION=+